MMAWIYADGRFFGLSFGVKLAMSNQPGVVEIKDKSGNLLGAVAVTASSFVVISDNIPSSELPVQ
jgi:hypothetical protein